MSDAPASAEAPHPPEGFTAVAVEVAEPERCRGRGFSWKLRDRHGQLKETCPLAL